MFDLDQFAKDLEIKIKGVIYHIPPVTYEITQKVGSLVNAKTDDELFKLMSEVLNTNKDDKVFTTDEVKSMFNLIQIKEFFKFILGQISDIEKN